MNNFTNEESLKYFLSKRLIGQLGGNQPEEKRKVGLFVDSLLSDKISLKSESGSKKVDSWAGTIMVDGLNLNVLASFIEKDHLVIIFCGYKSLKTNVPNIVFGFSFYDDECGEWHLNNFKTENESWELKSWVELPFVEILNFAMSMEVFTQHGLIWSPALDHDTLRHLLQSYLKSLTR